MSRIADTSALYAAFVAEDQHHAEARAAFSHDEPTIVPSEIFAETLALLQYRIGFDAATHAGEALRATPHIRILPATAALVESAWQIFTGAKGRLSPPGAFVVAWARAESAKALSYDKEIQRALARG